MDFRSNAFAMAENFHTVALDGVPIFGLHNRTAAYRFVTLVDVSLFSRHRFSARVHARNCKNDNYFAFIGDV